MRRSGAVNATALLLLALAVVAYGVHSADRDGTEALTQQDFERYQRQFAAEFAPVPQQLLAAGDAEALAAAAMFIYSPADLAARNAQRLELLNAAVALEPRRPELLWLQLMACEAVDACDLTAPTARLHELDPGNGAAWHPMMFRASKLRQSDEVQRLLRLTAESERFDTYWNASVVSLTDAVGRTGRLTPARSLEVVIGALAAESLPALGLMTRPCRGAAVEDPGQLMLCRKLATVLRAGDSELPEAVGLAMARQLWPAGTAERADADAVHRAMTYRQKVFIERGMRHEQDHRLMDVDYAQQLRQMRIQRREQDALVATLTHAGLSLDPPPDWKEGRNRINGQ